MLNFAVDDLLLDGNVGDAVRTENSRWFPDLSNVAYAPYWTASQADHGTQFLYRRAAQRT